MGMLFHLCISISLGIMGGFLVGVIRQRFVKNVYSEKQKEVTKKFVEKFANGLKYIIFAGLLIGFIWCMYFLILGIVDRTQVEYANNMAELIVAVLTVISIIFAFLEFLRRKDS